MVEIVQDAVTDWILENKPELIWQLDNILMQIESNWFLDEVFAEIEREIMAFSSLTPYDFIEDDCDDLHFDEFAITSGGGPQLIGDDYYRVLEISQRNISPHIIGLNEIMLDDGTFIYTHIYDDDYVPMTFSGTASEMIEWALENEIEIDLEYWEEVVASHESSDFNTENHGSLFDRALREIIHIPLDEDEDLRQRTLRLVDYITLDDGSEMYFELFIPFNSCSVCQLVGCGRLGWSSWRSISSAEHFRTCNCCGLSELQRHSLSTSWTSGSQHITTCSSCGYS